MRRLFFPPQLIQLKRQFQIHPQPWIVERFAQNLFNPVFAEQQRLRMNIHCRGNAMQASALQDRRQGFREMGVLLPVVIE